MRLVSLLVCSVWLVASVNTARAEAPPPAPGNDGSYEAEAVGVRNLTPLPSSERSDRSERSALPDTPWDACQGRDHHPIDEEAFFRIVGRDDLLGRYHRRAVVKKGLKIGGGTLIFGGLIFAAISTSLRFGGAQPAVGCEGTDCSSASSRGPSPVWGLAIAGAGAVSLIVGHSLDPTPIDANEADSLARTYDQSLQRRLGFFETAVRE